MGAGSLWKTNRGYADSHTSAGGGHYTSERSKGECSVQHPFVGHAGRHVPVARDREVVERSQLDIEGVGEREGGWVGQHHKQRP